MNVVKIRTRLVYLQPNPYSDEAIAIGVLYGADGRIALERIGSGHNISVLRHLYDEDFTEQVLFSLQLLDEQVRGPAFAIDSAHSPTELLKFGAASNAVCENPEDYVRDLLRVSSSLFGKYRVVKSDGDTIDQEAVERRLKESIVRINPLLGRALVQTRRVDISGNRKIEIPFYGERIMGASVSLSTSKPGGATHSGEALVARLNWAREALLSRENTVRHPIVYVLVPSRPDLRQKCNIEDSVGELELIAKASRVDVRSATDIETLAQHVYEDESLYMQ